MAEEYIMTTTNSDAPPQVSRNCQIDLLRVIFTVLTVLQHSIILNIDNVNLPYSHAGDFAVEFFFCVSGYYMVSSWEKSLDRFPNDNLNNTLSFMKHKIQWNCVSIPGWLFACYDHSSIA